MPIQETVTLPVPTAVILTAIPDEIDAVLNHLSNVREVCHGSLIFDVGEFAGNSATWRVAVAECGPGNVPVTLFVSSAVERFAPDVLFFVGIAGGLKDVSLGDVVAASKTYFHPAGKAEEHFQPRPELESPDGLLDQRARAVRRRGKWIDRIGSHDLAATEKPKAFVGPTASGENVVAHDKSQLFLLLRDKYGDALAVEMEGYGFLKAARFHRRPAIVLRGISDLCAGKGETDKEGWQRVASLHVAAFAFEMLANTERPIGQGALPLSSARIGEDSTGGQPASGVAAEPNHDQLRLIKSFHEFSGTLISRLVDASHWIPRPEEHDIRKLTEQEDGVVCLLGGQVAEKLHCLRASQRTVCLPEIPSSRSRQTFFRGMHHSSHGSVRSAS